MALAEEISKLNGAELSEKQEYYLNIVKLLSQNTDSTYDGLNNEYVKKLCCSILDDFRKETSELPQVVKLMQSVFQNKYLQKFLPEAEKQKVIKDIISIIDSSQHENVLVNCFSALIQVPYAFKLENLVVNDLLERMGDILTKNNDPASTYSLCSYYQKFLREYEETLSNFIPVLSKLIFLPLCHPSNKVREVAEKNLDMFPKLLLYTSDEQATAFLVKLVKETYVKDLLHLFKEKHGLYVLKVWRHVVNALGSALPANLSTIPAFFQVIEKGFKSSVDDICIASFIAWKCLIDNFAASDDVLNDSKKLRFILKPFKNISRSNENVLSVACDVWMHLAWNLTGHLSNRFTEVCIPLLELTVGKISHGLSEKSFHKGGSVSLVKKSCHILLRFLEQPPSESFNHLSSPKKLPQILYPTLQTPLDIKIITHHFKEILHTFKIIIDACGTKEDMKPYLDCLMKSVLFIVSTVIEDTNKESIEAVTCYLNFLTDIIETKTYSSLACLKCLESLSKLSRKVLVSHCFNCGSRKTQDILCTSLLKLLLNPHIFPSESPKRFYAAFNRLVQAGIHESFHPLSNTHKFMHVIRSTIGMNSFDVEIIMEVWSGVATPILEVIEKTQEVNQGDKQEHDFSCMYDVLIFPFEFIFPIYVHQFRTRPAYKLWTSLYKAFIRSASLVTTTATNEACEKFCCKLKSYLKEDLLKKPHFFELLCLLMQSIIESFDFVSGSTSGSQGIADVALMMKRRKPLGNLTSFVDLLVILLKAYHAHYIEADDDSIQSNIPATQRKLHIVKNAAPIDILKTFFGNIKSGSIISCVLGQTVDPVSKLFVKSSQKRNLLNHVDAKLEMLWNVITSCIERYYLGPYDSEFLTLMAPILEATFSHTKRNLKEKSRRFWFATFAPNASSLKFPESLKNILKKMKVPLLLDDINPTEFSISPLPDSISEDMIDLNIPDVPKPSLKSPLNMNGEISKVITKENKQPQKMSIDDLPGQEFVKIDSPILSTPRRRTVRKRKSFVPSLYNDLSQDTSTLMSSSESQDTVGSASLEQSDGKKSMTEIKTTSEKKVMNIPSSSHKAGPSTSKNVVNSSLSVKFEEKIKKNLRSEKDIILIEPFEGVDEAENKNKKLKLDSSNHSEEDHHKNDLVANKMSVFSKPIELVSRSTRKNSQLSQSFSFPSIKKDSQKLNKSCIELIDLSDSEDIIPSSQGGSSEIEISIKLAVSNGQLKSQLSDNSNCDINKKVSPISSLAESENNKIVSDDDDFKTENLPVKVLTSTPSKSKISTLINDDKTCEVLAKNFKDISNNVPMMPINSFVNSDKPGVSSIIIKVIDTEPQNTTSEFLDECTYSKMQCNSEEKIDNLNFLLDAVDNLVSVNGNTKPVNKNLHKLPSDVEMIDISGSESKITEIASSCIQNRKIQSRTDEPITKKSCLGTEISDQDSQSENYSQRLRKKNNNALTKSQPKTVKKTVTKKGLKRNLKNVGSKNKIIELQNTNLDTCDPEKSKEEQILSSEKLEIDIKTSHLDGTIASNLIVEQSDENSAKSVENTENLESCEIFETFSGSCKDTEENVKNVNSEDMMLVDATDSGGFIESNIKENECIKPEFQFEEGCKSQSRTSNVDAMNSTPIIPSSLDTCNEFMSGAESVMPVKDSVISSVVAPPLEIVDNSANEIASEPLFVQFSISEDDLSCEMHNIVNSIVDRCSQNSINEDLCENNSTTNSQNKVKETLQSSISSSHEVYISSDFVGEKSDLPIEEQNSKPKNHGESSNDDDFNVCAVNKSNAIILNETESKLDNSAIKLISSHVMDIDNMELGVKNENLKEKENLTELKLTQSPEVSLSKNHNNNFSPELDHSYSISDKITDFKQTTGKEIQRFDETDPATCNNSERETNLYSVDKTRESIFNSSENEVKFVLKDLIVKVDKLNYDLINTVNCDVFSSANNYMNLENPVADKENQMLSDINAKGSKKRKIKLPIRSPFNFRHRSKIENSKKLHNSLKSLNDSQIKSITKNKGLIITPIPFQDEHMSRENSENSMAKLISSIVDSVTNDENICDMEMDHQSVPSSSQMSKGGKSELSNDELTDLNTRLNASIAPQTRRSKKMAATLPPETENKPVHSNVEIMCSENSSVSLSGILKKRKSSMPLPSAKVRNVTFAHPLVTEVLIENLSQKAGNANQTYSKKRYKVFQEKNKKTIPIISSLPANSIESEEVPSSSEYQDSDVLDFSDLPVSPALINCPDNISNILKHLTSPSWEQGLESLLLSKNIKTIGDVCKLNIHQVKALPFKSPKVLTLHKALMTYINHTQEATLQKFKTIDDGSFLGTDASSSCSSGPKTVKNAEIPVKEKSQEGKPRSSEAEKARSSETKEARSLEVAVMEVLKKERLKELPLKVLGQLVEACGKAIVEKK